MTKGRSCLAALMGMAVLAISAPSLPAGEGPAVFHVRENGINIPFSIHFNRLENFLKCLSSIFFSFYAFEHRGEMDIFNIGISTNT